MTQISKEVPRVYLDSNWLVKLIKPVFALVFFSQLLQAMVFNGVLDFPLLLMILVMLSLYAFRKSYYFFFQVLCIYIVLLIHLVVTLKILYLILTKIGYIQLWFVANKEKRFVFVCRVLFGIDFDKLKNAEGVSELTQCSFYFLLLTCKLTAGAYK